MNAHFPPFVSSLFLDSIALEISLGDSQSYLLSTAENELGVVVARSEAGEKGRSSGGS